MSSLVRIARIIVPNTVSMDVMLVGPVDIAWPVVRC